MNRPITSSNFEEHIKSLLALKQIHDLFYDEIKDHPGAWRAQSDFPYHIYDRWMKVPDYVNRCGAMLTAEMDALFPQAMDMEPAMRQILLNGNRWTAYQMAVRFVQMDLENSEGKAPAEDYFKHFSGGFELMSLNADDPQPRIDPNDPDWPAQMARCTSILHTVGFELWPTLFDLEAPWWHALSTNMDARGNEWVWTIKTFIDISGMGLPIGSINDPEKVRTWFSGQDSQAGA